jgi:hypothetical protein
MRHIVEAAGKCDIRDGSLPGRRLSKQFRGALDALAKHRLHDGLAMLGEDSMCFYSATPAFNGVLLSVQQHVDMRDVSVGGSDRSSGGSMDTSFFLLVFCNK